MSFRRVRNLVLGRSPRRTVRAILIAAVMTAGVTATFLGLFRLGRSAGYVGSGGYAIQYSPTSWSLEWMNWGWLAVLAACCTIAAVLALWHARRGGGLVGVLALVSAVPLGTVFYERIVWDYPLIRNPLLESVEWDPVEMWIPVGITRVPGWTVSRWWYHVLFLLAIAIIVLALGRWLAAGVARDPTTGIAVAGLWFGTFLTGYMHPTYDVSHFDLLTIFGQGLETVVESAYLFGAPIWYASIVAVAGYLLISAYRVARERISDGALSRSLPG